MKRERDSRGEDNRTVRRSDDSDSNLKQPTIAETMADMAAAASSSRSFVYIAHVEHYHAT
jgi:hypothetical protein